MTSASSPVTVLGIWNPQKFRSPFWTFWTLFCPFSSTMLLLPEIAKNWAVQLFQGYPLGLAVSTGISTQLPYQKPPIQPIWTQQPTTEKLRLQGGNMIGCPQRCLSAQLFPWPTASQATNANNELKQFASITSDMAVCQRKLNASQKRAKRMQAFA